MLQFCACKLLWGFLSSSEWCEESGRFLTTFFKVINDAETNILVFGKTAENLSQTCNISD